MKDIDKTLTYTFVSLKRKPRFNPKSLKIEKQNREIVISGCIFIFLLYGTLIVNTGSWMAAQQSFL